MKIFDPNDEDTGGFEFEGLSLSKRARFFAFEVLIPNSKLQNCKITLILFFALPARQRRDIGATRGLDRIRSPGAGRTDGRQEEVTDDHHQSS
jgi:hypothetical protein